MKVAIMISWPYREISANSTNQYKNGLLLFAYRRIGLTSRRFAQENTNYKAQRIVQTAAPFRPEVVYPWRSIQAEGGSRAGRGGPKRETV